MEGETKHLAVTISRLLNESKFTEVLALHNDNKYEEIFKNGSWELVPAVVSKIQDSTLIVNAALHSTCEKLLNIIVEKGNAEEVLLELIDQVESAKNDSQFLISLNPMQKVLFKLENKQNRSLEWCFNAIATYIENIPIPEYSLEGRERVLMDCDDSVRRIEKIYLSLPEFYTSFINQYHEAAQFQTTSTGESKQVIAGFLIGLLGKPMIYLDVERGEMAQSTARQCCQTLINDICKLEKDILRLLNYVVYKYEANSKKMASNNVTNETGDLYFHNEKLPITSLGGLLYVTLSGDFDLPDYALVQVYNAEYIVYNSLLAVDHLLNFTEYGPLTKGLSLCKALLQRLSKPASHTLLLSPVYFKVLKSLVNVAVFSNYEKIRKEAVNLIGYQVNIFEYEGRCKLIKSLLDMANHSGVIGYSITLFKNSIEEVFKSQKEFPDCFTNANLMEMLKKILSLPYGAESDLVELADQIITALNFLIYITLKDKTNKTGIRDCYQFIETEYLNKLRIGIDMSRAHYQVKLKDIEEESKRPQKKLDISINIGGNTLDDIPPENQKQVIYSALNAFHLMEGLWARVCECININKSKI